ncbi:hypothetical protein AB1N83_012644, partial [Pleurotus pulmonarius]
RTYVTLRRLSPRVVVPALSLALV